MKAIDMIVALTEIVNTYGNVDVTYFDTWWEAEGWGDNADESQYNYVDSISYSKEDNIIQLI